MEEPLKQLEGIADDLCRMTEDRTSEPGLVWLANQASGQIKETKRIWNQLFDAHIKPSGPSDPEPGPGERPAGETVVQFPG